jgi:hypothetical protein
MHPLIEYLDEEIKSLHFDLKAEVLVADIIQHRELEQDEILIQNIGIHRRPYSKDINMAYLPDEGPYSLILQTNREGIYDALPEALFHQPFQSKRIKNKEDLLHEIKIHREEERYARRFFTPFENELNQLRVNLELNERRSLDIFNNKSVVSIFYKLWGGAVLNLTQEQLSILFILLPHIDQIKANPELMSFCYSKLLKDEIQIILEYRNCTDALNEDNGSVIGSDFTCGNSLSYQQLNYVVTVKLRPQSYIEEYLPDGLKYKMISFFNDYFIPYTADSDLRLLHDTATTADKTLFFAGNSFLGANTYI